MTTIRGVWIDDSVHDVLQPKFWDTLVAHKFTTGALMLEGLGHGFDPSYSEDMLGKLGALARERDCEFVLTCWPEPKAQYLIDFEAKIGALLTAAGAAALESDLEGNWLPGEVKGFPNIDKAGDELVQVYGDVLGRIDCRAELTTYPFHPENNKSADVAPHVDVLLPQAYSVYKRKVKGADTPQDWDGNYGPGHMQTLTLDKAKLVHGTNTPGGPVLSCGLAAYDQVWPGRKGEDAMRVAYDAAMLYAPREIRWWSSKWIFGHLSNGYASRFFKSL